MNVCEACASHSRSSSALAELHGCKHGTHWLNGQKGVEFERGSQEYRALVAQNKYKTIPGFEEWEDGHILLQDDGNRVFFQNIKIRVLPD